MRSFESFDEFMEICFPRQYEERIYRKGIPEEVGRYIAEKGLEKFREILTK